LGKIFEDLNTLFNADPLNLNFKLNHLTDKLPIALAILSNENDDNIFDFMINNFNNLNLTHLENTKFLNNLQNSIHVDVKDLKTDILTSLDSMMSLLPKLQDIQQNSIVAVMDLISQLPSISLIMDNLKPLLTTTSFKNWSESLNSFLLNNFQSISQIMSLTLQKVASIIVGSVVNEIYTMLMNIPSLDILKPYLLLIEKFSLSLPHIENLL
jgi:hypothetical protein